MESTDQYNFSLFQPRNKHGRKNRNVILTMILIWAVAVFGFQILLKVLEKPTTEKTLEVFTSAWSPVLDGTSSQAGYQNLLSSLLLVQGKNNALPGDKQLLTDAISLTTFSMIPDSLEPTIRGMLKVLKEQKAMLINVKDQEYLTLKADIIAQNQALLEMLSPYTSFSPGSLEGSILINTIDVDFPVDFGDASFQRLPDVMAFYLTHNQSVLTDTKFLGFPFHYFYTAVFLLILFVVLCIAYNILIEWRLKKEHITE